MTAAPQHPDPQHPDPPRPADSVREVATTAAPPPERAGIEPAALKDITTRLRRARGQLDGIITMIETGRSCRDVATQLSAASKALDRVGYKLIAANLAQCLATDEADRELTPAEIEKLFISLA